MTTLRQLIDKEIFEVESNNETDTTDYYVKEQYEVHFGKHEYAFFEVSFDGSVEGHPVESFNTYHFNSIDDEIDYKVKVLEITKSEIAL